MLSTSSLLTLGVLGLSLGTLVAAEDPLYPRTNDTYTVDTNQCDELNCWKTTTCTEWYCNSDCGYGHTSTVYTTIYSTIITTTSIYEENTVTRTRTEVDYEPTTIYRTDLETVTDEITATDYETTTILSSFPYTITVSKCSFTPASTTEESYTTYYAEKRAESAVYEPDTHDGDCVISTQTLWSTVTQTTVVPSLIPTTITKATTYYEVSTVTYTTEIPTTVVSDHSFTRTIYYTSTFTSEVTLTKSYTDFETVTDVLTSWVTELVPTTYYSTISYPVTVTNGYTSYSTVISTYTTYITRTLPPETETETDFETVTDVFTSLITELVPTTYYSTISYPVTVTDGYTSYSTEITTIISTYTTYITQTLPPETIPGPTRTLTQPGPTRTITEPGEITTSVSTTTVTQSFIITISLSGSLTTILSTTTFVSTLTAPTTVSVTLPASTVLIPGSVSTETIISTLPPVTTTIELPGTTYTTTLPASTITATREITVPPVTVYPPPQTLILTTTVPASVTTCAAPTNTPGSNPPTFDPKSDLTWGCKPGFVCNPPKPDDCNVWADSPEDSYVCQPQWCEPAPWFPIITWPENETSYYPPTEGYFDLNPNAFGLSYDIFEEEVIVEKVNGKLTSVITGNWASQSTLTHFPPESTSSPTPTPYAKAKRGKQSSSHLILKRDDTVVPAVCFDTCNNAYLEAQSVGKTPDLCTDGSPFMNYYEGCDLCIKTNQPQQKLSTKQYLETKFSQFINYCDSTAAESQTTPSSTAEAQQSTTANVETTTQAPPNTSGEPTPIPVSSSSASSPASSSASPPPPPSTTSEITSEEVSSTVGSPTPESSTPETTSGPEPTGSTPIPSESSSTETITSLSSSPSSSTPGPTSVTTAGAQYSSRSSYAGLILPLLACIFFI